MGAIFSGASLCWPRSSPLQRGVTISLGAHCKLCKRLRRGTATAFLTSVAVSLALCGAGKYTFIYSSQQATFVKLCLHMTAKWAGCGSSAEGTGGAPCWAQQRAELSVPQHNSIILVLHAALSFSRHHYSKRNLAMSSGLQVRLEHGGVGYP